MANRGYDGAIIIRIDTRPDSTLIETIAGPIPREKRVPVHKKQAQYKFDVMDGAPHPLNIEVANYILVAIRTCTVDPSTIRQDDQSNRHLRLFSKDELAFIQSVTDCPEVEWAIDNSFDGLYVQRSDYNFAFATQQYKFAVYLKEEQATFWKLKFHGR